MGSKVDELIKSMNKDMKDAEFISKGIPKYDYDRIPFTSPRLNYMSFGGIPMTKLIEFYGEEHGGKTTTALDIVANYQHMENAKGVLYADIENRLDIVWATKLGIDFNRDDFYLLKPSGQGAETILEQIIELIKTGEIGLVVIDSIAAMESDQEFEKSLEDKSFGGISAALSRFSKRGEQFCHKYDCTIIGINQEREDIGSPIPGKKKTPGGKAWKYHCSARFEFRSGKYLDEKGNELTQSAESPAGRYIVVAMTKNSTCPPTRRTGFYTINFYTGIDYLKDLVEVAIKYGIIEKSGAWFSIIDPENGEQVVKLQGQAKVNEYLENEENSEVLEKIENFIDSAIHEE